MVREKVKVINDMIEWRFGVGDARTDKASIMTIPICTGLVAVDA